MIVKFHLTFCHGAAHGLAQDHGARYNIQITFSVKYRAGLNHYTAIAQETFGGRSHQVMPYLAESIQKGFVTCMCL